MSAAGSAERAASRPILRIGSWLSLPLERRALVVGGVTALALVGLSLFTLTLGSLGIPLPKLAGQIAHPDAKSAFILTIYRGPRLVTAIGVGAAFGIAGALFQTVTRNPLGSPDVIGLSSGASAGAATFGLLIPGILPLPLGALVGAVAAIVLVYVGTGRGFTSPGRMILVGIGVAAMALAYVQFVITKVSAQDAVVLGAYISGTLADRSWTDVAVVFAALVVLVPCALALSRRLDLVEMGDELADALGARTALTRTLVVLVALGLSTSAVAAAGPISFIALTAPQVARRLARGTGASVVLSGLTGAFLLVLADLLVQQAPFGVQLPVGLVTSGVGGVYLGYLLIAEWKKGVL